uniref:VWFA domain-containing protein n=1 Tax=Haemonchus placei TaxID=6290 RepID=A0A0N4W0N8_HAEPC
LNLICPPVLDIAFVLDTSGSIEEIYNEQVRWTVSLTDALPIAKDAVRLSTIQYAGYPLTEFSLDTYNDKGDVERHLREMSFQSGVTRTGYALRRAEDELFNEDRGASKIVALFTDGLSIDDPLKPSEHLRLLRGVKIYVVSVSADGFVPEMQRIAGETISNMNSAYLVTLLDFIFLFLSFFFSLNSRYRNLRWTSTMSIINNLFQIMFTSTTMNPMQFLRTTKAITNIPDITFSSQNQSPPSTLPFTHEGVMERKRAFASKTTLFDEKSTAFPTPHEGSVGEPRSFVPRTEFDKPESAMFPTPHEGAVGTPRAFAPKILQGIALRHRPEVTVPPVPSTEAPRIRPEVTVPPVPSTEAPRIRPTVTVPPVPSTEAPRILAPVLAPLPLATRVSQNDGKSPAHRTIVIVKMKNVSGSSRGKCPLDILFIVDSSGSVGEIYEKQKEFLLDLLSSIEPENQSHRVGLIQFAGAKLQKTEWSFETYRDHSGLMQAFNGVRHFTGTACTTYIGAALESAVQLLGSRRPDVTTLVILISDGFSQDDAVRPAEVIRAMKNVELYAVSLSRLSNRSYLQQIVKDEEKISMDNDTSYFGNRLKSRINCGY